MSSDMSATNLKGQVFCLSAAELRQNLAGGEELALLDVRETGVHATEGHILLSVNLPLSQLEFRIATLVPRKNTRAIFYDGGDEKLAFAAALRAAALGYTNAGILSAGAQGWRQAGFELFTGTNVIGKAFGEFVEHTYGTAFLNAEAVKARVDGGENIIVIDVRPENEFNEFNIDGAVNLPGAEIVYRFHEVVSDPETLVVVNCAGRTRGIIGAQALVNAGIVNPVASMLNGTIGWVNAGLSLQSGKSNLGAVPSGEAFLRAKASAARLRQKFGVRTIGQDELVRFQKDQTDGRRSLYILDVRGEAEYQSGHVPDSVLAPGGQLVQQLGHWVGTRNSRIVLVDNPDGVRAAISASWLIQINWAEVYVLADPPEDNLLEGPEVTVNVAEPADVDTISPRELQALATQGKAVVVDLANSQAYCQGHIPGAYFAIRSYLVLDPVKIPGAGLVVLTSSDSVLAGFAAHELADVTTRPLRVLSGGTRAWRDLDLPVETGPGHALHPFEDLFPSAWTLPEVERPPAFKAYIDWELGLVEQLERDGTADFKVFR